ncbi:MAG: hypothetical protein JNJ59_04290, partial [Deltaproteobacteria bacterium]|nr:hypothetical protein [Deltaproteobacteria bacterium]
MADHPSRLALGDIAARQLATTTKTAVQQPAITPRWVVSLLEWVPVESGTYRINRVRSAAPIDVVCGARDERPLPETFVDYEEKPREHALSVISTVVDVHTRVSDLYSNPHDQIKEQLRLTIEGVKERQEAELFVNDDYGLLNQAIATQRLKTRKGPPTPDDLDELITKVWKEPTVFLAHPRTIAAFGRECTRRGVPPPTVTLFGSPFITWRGIPLIPSDKIPVTEANTSSILLVRIGQKKQGVVGLFQPGLPGEQTPGLSVR